MRADPIQEAKASEKQHANRISKQLLFFGNELKKELRSLNTEYLKIIKDRPGFLATIKNIIVRHGLRIGGAALGNKAITAAADNKAIGEAVGAGINFVALVIFYLKDSNDDARYDAAKRVEEHLKKIGGVETFANRVSENLSGRLYYLLLTLADSENGHEEIKSLTKFLAAAAMSILLKMDFNEEDIENNIIPDKENGLYDINFLKIIRVSKELNYNNKNYAMRDVLVDCPAYTPEDGFVCQKKPYVTKEGFLWLTAVDQWHPPQRLKGSEKLGYFREAPDLKVIQNTSDPQKYNEEMLKTFYADLLASKKMESKYIVLYQNFFRERKILIKEINSYKDKNKINESSLAKQINIYAESLFLYHFYVIFDPDGLGINKLSILDKEVSNFLNQEIAWLDGLIGAVDSHSTGTLLYLASFQDYFKKAELDPQRRTNCVVFLNYLNVLSTQILSKTSALDPGIKTLGNFIMSDSPKNVETLADEVLTHLFRVIDLYKSEEIQLIANLQVPKKHSQKALAEIICAGDIEVLQDKFLQEEKHFYEDQKQRNQARQSKKDKELPEDPSDFKLYYQEQVLNKEDSSGKLPLEYACNIKDSKIFSAIVRKLVKQGADPKFFIYKVLYGVVDDSKKLILDDAKITLIALIVKTLRKEVIPNASQLKNLQIAGFKTKNYKTLKFTDVDFERKVNNLEKLTDQQYHILVYFICMTSDAQRELYRNHANINYTLSWKYYPLYEESIFAEHNIHGESIWEYALVFYNKNIINFLCVRLGITSRFKIKFDEKSLQDYANNQELTAIADGIEKQIKTWSQIFLGKISFYESLLANYDDHRNYNSLYIILRALRTSDTNDPKDFTIYNIIRNYNEHGLFLLDKLIDVLHKRIDAEKYLRILYNIIMSPAFVDFVNSEQTKSVILTPITLAASCANLKALKVFRRLIEAFLLSAEFDNKEISELTSEESASLDRKVSMLFNQQDEFEFSPLHYAVIGLLATKPEAKNEIANTVEWLLKFGIANPLIRTKSTPDDLKNLIEKLIENNEEVGAVMVPQASEEVFYIEDFTRESSANYFDRKAINGFFKAFQKKWISHLKQGFCSAKNDDEILHWASYIVSLCPKIADKFKNEHTKKSPKEIYEAASPSHALHMKLERYRYQSKKELHGDNFLFDVVGTISIETFEKHLKTKPHLVNYQNNCGVTLLMLTVSLRRADLAIVLIKLGARKDFKTYGNYTRKFQRLVKAPNNPGYTNSKEETVTIVANRTANELIEDDNPDAKVLKKILNREADDFYVLDLIQSIHDKLGKGAYADNSGRIDSQKLISDLSFLEEKIDKNPKYVARFATDRKGNTFLHLVIKLIKRIEAKVKTDEISGHKEKIFEKLQELCGIFITKNCSALFWKNLKGKQIVPKVLEQDQENTSTFKFIAVILGKFFTNSELFINEHSLALIAQYIGERSSEVTFRDKRGHTPLGITAYHGLWAAFDVILQKLVLNKEIDHFNVRSSEHGFSALHYLCFWPESVSGKRAANLIGKGAAVNLKSLRQFDVDYVNYNFAEALRNECLEELRKLRASNEDKDQQRFLKLRASCSSSSRKISVAEEKIKLCDELLKLFNTDTLIPFYTLPTKIRDLISTTLTQAANSRLNIIHHEFAVNSTPLIIASRLNNAVVVAAILEKIGQAKEEVLSKDAMAYSALDYVVKYRCFEALKQYATNFFAVEYLFSKFQPEKQIASVIIAHEDSELDIYKDRNFRNISVTLRSHEQIKKLEQDKSEASSEKLSEVENLNLCLSCLINEIMESDLYESPLTKQNYLYVIRQLFIEDKFSRAVGDFAEEVKRIKKALVARIFQNNDISVSEDIIKQAYTGVDSEFNSAVQLVAREFNDDRKTKNTFEFGQDFNDASFKDSNTPLTILSKNKVKLSKKVLPDSQANLAHVAVLNGYINLTKFCAALSLLSQGEKNGFTPVHLFIYQYKDMKDLSKEDDKQVLDNFKNLLNANNINIADNKGRTPLFLALLYSNEMLVELLLSKGAVLGKRELTIAAFYCQENDRIMEMIGNCKIEKSPVLSVPKHDQTKQMGGVSSFWKNKSNKIHLGNLSAKDYWYTHQEVEKLLHHYLSSDIQIIETQFPLLQHKNKSNGNLRDTICDVLKNFNDAKKPVVIPVNLLTRCAGENPVEEDFVGNRWSLIIIKNIQIEEHVEPQILFIDPLGNNSPDQEDIKIKEPRHLKNDNPLWKSHISHIGKIMLAALTEAESYDCRVTISGLIQQHSDDGANSGALLVANAIAEVDGKPRSKNPQLSELRGEHHEVLQSIINTP